MANEENADLEAENSTATAVAAPTPAEVDIEDSSTGSTLVKERFEIMFDTPMPHLDTNGATAYKTIDKINAKRELFALICSNEVPPRSSLLPYLKSIDNPHLMKLVEFGIVDYAKSGSRNVALIYETPLGGKVSDFKEGDITYKSNPDKFKSIILSLLSAIEVLRGYRITHRAIRSDNVYYKDEARTEIVIGDCAASFPAFYQDARFETIESAFALPEGRGNGSSGDDIYAIGVLLLSLLLQKNPLEGLSDPEILRLKIKKGSYAALTNDERVPNQITAMLKGMLNDTPELRWGYLPVYNFLEGKPVNFNNNGILDNKSQRALIINGDKAYTPQSAAIMLLNSPKEAFELIKSGKLSEWVKNGLENEKIYIKLDKLIKQDADNISDCSNIVTRACIMLDPHLPIKYDELIIFPDGAPKAIFYALKHQGHITDFVNLFSSDLIKLWYQEQDNMRSPANASEFKIYVTRKDIGYGIDRIMYDFDEDLPCTSPLLGDDFVNSASKVLRALDKFYDKNKPQYLPYDRNLIAFLRCKMGKKIDGILTDLNSNKENIQNSAIIRLFTNMQNKYGPVQLPNLAKWLINIAKPVIMSYRNVKYQKYLERELLKISKSGKLNEICEMLENDEARNKDKTDYAAAINEINYLLTEKSKLVGDGSKLDDEARGMAIKFASVLAILTMVMSFILNLTYWVMK